MRFEYGIIIAMAILTAAILVSIQTEPQKIPYWESFRHFTVDKLSYTEDPAIFEKTKNELFINGKYDFNYKHLKIISKQCDSYGKTNNRHAR